MFVNTGGIIAAIIANQNAQRMRRERDSMNVQNVNAEKSV